MSRAILVPLALGLFWVTPAAGQITDLSYHFTSIGAFHNFEDPDPTGRLPDQISWHNSEGELRLTHGSVTGGVSTNADGLVMVDDFTWNIAAWDAVIWQAERYVGGIGGTLEIATYHVFMDSLEFGPVTASVEELRGSRLGTITGSWELSIPQHPEQSQSGTIAVPVELTTDFHVDVTDDGHIIDLSFRLIGEPFGLERILYSGELFGEPTHLIYSRFGAQAGVNRLHSCNFVSGSNCGVWHLSWLAGRISENDPVADLNADGLVNLDDHAHLVSVMRFIYGDANRDRRFDSNDLVDVFQTGHYETTNSARWETGDWNGDRQFNSSDLVLAFQQGEYEQDPRVAVRPVPEPTGVALMGLGLLIYARYRKPSPD